MCSRCPAAARPSISFVEPKVLQTLSTAAATPWGRFTTVYLLGRGVSPSTLGVLRGIKLICKFVSYSLWGLP